MWQSSKGLDPNIIHNDIKQQSLPPKQQPIYSSDKPQSKHYRTVPSGDSKTVFDIISINI